MRRLNGRREMSIPDVVAQKKGDAPSQSETDTQLHGYWLMFARAAWLIIACVAVAMSIAEIPPGYARYLTVCTQSLCQNQQATPAMVRALHSAGLTLQFYAIFLEILGSIAVSIFVGVGAIIAWRKSRDWMGLLVSLALVLFETQVRPFKLWRSK